MTDNQILTQILSEVQGIKHQLGKVEEKVDNLEAKVDNLETKVDNLETKVDNLETKVDSLETKVDNLETKTDRLELEMDILKVATDKLTLTTERNYDAVLHFYGRQMEDNRKIEDAMEKLETRFEIYMNQTEKTAADVRKLKIGMVSEERASYRVEELEKALKERMKKKE